MHAPHVRSSLPPGQGGCAAARLSAWVRRAAGEHGRDRVRGGGLAPAPQPPRGAGPRHVPLPGAPARRPGCQPRAASALPPHPHQARPRAPAWLAHKKLWSCQPVVAWSCKLLRKAMERRRCIVGLGGAAPCDGNSRRRAPRISAQARTMSVPRRLQAAGLCGGVHGGDAADAHPRHCAPRRHPARAQAGDQAHHPGACLGPRALHLAACYGESMEVHAACQRRTLILVGRACLGLWQFSKLVPCKAIAKDACTHVC